MSGSTEFLANTSYRPSASSFSKSNIINHFQQQHQQQNTHPIKKSSSFNANRSAKNNDVQSSVSKATSNSQTTKNSDSRSTVRNHVQFALPLDINQSNTPTNSNNNFFTVLTPTNSNSSLNKNSEFKSFNTNSNDMAHKNMHNGTTRLSNTAPLKNLTRFVRITVSN